MGARTGTPGDALATPPFLTLLRSDRIRTIGIDEPLATIVTEGSGHALVLPLGGLNHNTLGTTTGEPLPTRVVRDTDALVTLPFVTMLRGSGDQARGLDEPLATVVATGGNHALTVPPFITMLRGPGNAPTGVDEPLATMTTGRNHGLTIPPFIVKNYGGYCSRGHNAAPVADPLSAVAVRDGHALVVPYRGKRSRATTTAEPLHTMATRDSAALVQADDSDIAECRLRMLKPREHLRAQRFHDRYIVTGNQGEQTMQAGNAVPVNVAHWLGAAVAEVL